ncbi:hypothetical protein [Ramlibacter sp.]|uniref:hypothetical protein n=1 Tax=Ramlibacter sp. TaxID=1917967 RepID=UPI00262CE162|nr:hypothetical protein [Ramlibacter sp.]MDB5957555.1 hypothetical protein [Ramlibacter sp.]
MSWSRLLLRLQRHLVRGYEFFLVGLLLALVVLAAWPDARAQEGAAAPQCGKNQSSPVVMNR